MAIKESYNQAKRIAKKAFITYLALGTFYNFTRTMTGEITGHYSADLHEGKIQMSNLEKKFYNYVFDKLGIDNALLEKK